MKPSTLDRILAAVVYDEDDERSIEILREMLNPTTREEMGEVYEESIGYNPLTYFDRTDVEKYFEVMITDAPETVKETLIESKEEIFDNVIQHKENLNTDYLVTLLNLEMEHVAGWRNKKYPLLSFEEEFADLSEEMTDELDDDDEEYGDDFEDDEEDE